ncbi:MAG: DUF2087 domain-containing protein, partial [Ktedonobacterales bacterium]
FEYGRTYTEKEVNEILGRYHDDSATLRRELVGYKLLQRERAIYWRTSPTLRPQAEQADTADAAE